MKLSSHSTWKPAITVRAIIASKDLLKISPRHVPAHDALGAAYIGLGDTASAIRVANELIRIDPNSPSHRFTKAHLAQHVDDIPTAVDEFQRVCELAPDSDLAENAMEQLQTLDAHQLHQIMTLAIEDTYFRSELPPGLPKGPSKPVATPSARSVNRCCRSC